MNLENPKQPTIWNGGSSEIADFRLKLSYRLQRDLSSVEHIAHVACIDSLIIL
jgi:hypothetical protein